MKIMASLSGRDKKIKEAYSNRDSQTIRAIAEEQKSRGVDYLNLSFSQEDAFIFTIETLKDLNLPLSLDTHNLKLLSSVLKKTSYPISIINSTYPIKDNLKKYVQLAKEYNTHLVILSILKGRPSMSIRRRFLLMKEAINFLNKEGLPLNKIIIDLVILPFKYYPQHIYTPIILGNKLRAYFKGLLLLAGIDNFIYGYSHPLLYRFITHLLTPIVDIGIVERGEHLDYIGN